MHDPFEESLRDLLKASPPRNDDACLDRVLKTANRQVGVGDLFGLMGLWGQVVVTAFAAGSNHRAPVSRRTQRSTNKAG
ncbi:CrfX protein [Stutzerimonas urumqiensis]|uniref:CrfX protein n=1 Tax=Stutzerimonas urumqiensis TaxID=638269 RepID=UPI000EB01854|nr:CrfX protein [Stutzerimonas urumqiensis]